MAIVTAKKSPTPRCVGLVRMWRVLVLIRQEPRQLSELARMLSVTERTIRRDLDALARIPLPVKTLYPLGDGSRRGVPLNEWQPNEWYLEGFDAWPDGESTPVADIPMERDG